MIYLLLRLAAILFIDVNCVKVSLHVTVTFSPF